MKKFFILLFCLLTLLVSCQKEPETFRITLYAENGTSAIELIGNPGQSINLPTPTKEGYTFVEWYDDSGNKYGESITVPSNDLKLYARWEVLVSIKGRIAIPDGVDLKNSDFWIKVSDGKVVQVEENGEFSIVGLSADVDYALLFTNKQPSNVIKRELSADLSYGTYITGIKTSVSKTIDLQTISIMPTGVISGVVTLQNNSSSDNSGITVSIPETWLVTTTGEDGSYKIKDVPEGSYNLSFEKEGYISSTIGVTVKADDVKTNPTVVVPTKELAVDVGSINGLVQLEGLTDYSGVVVSVLGTTFSTTTNSSGKYNLTLPPGNYTAGIRFEKDDFISENYAESIVVSLGSRQSIPTVELKMKTIPEVKGKISIKGVSDASGITVKFSSSSEFSAVTNINGEWSIEHVPLGKYEFSTSGENVPDFITVIEFSPMALYDIGNITLIPNGASVSGYVLFDSSTTGKGIEAVIKAKTSGTEYKLSATLDGYYNFTNLDPEEDYQISFSKEGWKTETVDIQNLANYEKRVVDTVELVDVEPPQLAVFINGKENFTDNRDVILHIVASDSGSGLSRIEVSYDSDFSKIEYEGDYVESLSLSLTEGKGMKTIYVKAYDIANNCVTESTTITYKSDKYEISGVLDETNLHWTEDNSPYYLTGNVSVPSGSTLVIDPGVDVIFSASSYYIQVEGTLTAIGTPEKTINFYGKDEIKWSGIKFKNNNLVVNGTKFEPEYSSGSVLKNCKITNGGISGYLWIEDSSLKSTSYALGLSNESGFQGYAVNCDIAGAICHVRAVFKGNSILLSTSDTSESFGDSGTYFISNVFKSSSYNYDHNYGSSCSFYAGGCYLYNNIFYNTTLKDSWADYSFIEAKYNTFKNSYINLSKSTKLMEYDAFEGACTLYMTEDSYHPTVRFCNFNDECKIITKRQGGSAAFSYCFFGDNHTKELMTSGKNANISFISDYYDDFTFEKIDYSNWVSSEWINLGYHSEGYINYPTITALYTLSTEHTLTGNEVLVFDTESVAPSEIRFSDDIDLLLTDSVSWESITSSEVSHSNSSGTIEGVRFYFQVRNTTLNATSPIYMHELSGGMRSKKNICITGPAKGYVFYDCDEDNNNGNSDGLISSECGWRFLEAASDNLPSFYRFGFYRTSDTGSAMEVGTEEAVGKGKSNTEALVKAMGEDAYTSNNGTKKETYAAKACNDYSLTVDGILYDEWFLPSKNELNRMKTNLYENGFGNFQNALWSSTENGSDYAWYCPSTSDSSCKMERDYYWVKVRPVRAFL